MPLGLDRPRRFTRVLWAAVGIAVSIAALTHAATITYEYDKLGRLTKATYDNGVKTNYTLDQAGNRTAVANSSDQTAPPIPANFAGVGTATPSVNLSWTASLDTGGSGTGGYKIYRDNNLLATVNGASTTAYSDLAVLNSTPYSYQITAFDNAQNESARSTPPIGVTTLAGVDATKPTPPSNLTGQPASMTQVNLSWIGSTDSGGSGLTGYKIWRATGSGTSTQIGTSTQTSFNDTTASGNTSYTYQVYAYDGAGNTSDPSNAFFITTPSVPAGALTFDSPGAFSVNESVGSLALTVSRTGGTWSAASVTCTAVAAGGSSPATPGADFGNTPITLNWAAGETVAKTCTLPIVNDSLGEGYYQFIEGAGQLWFAWETFNVTLSNFVGATPGATPTAFITINDDDPFDTQAPSAPSGLQFTVVSPTRIDLTWTASTDNVAVSQYRVERCTGASCSNFANYSGAPSASYSDTFTAGSTTYRYRVMAMDARGNASGYSNIVQASTPDTTPPSAPVLSASAAAHNQINVSWPASSDNVGVTGYTLERCVGAGCSSFSVLVSPSSPGWSDTTVSGSTSYSYRAVARDAAGNVSGYSNVATATTPAPPDVTAPSAPGSLGASASTSQISLTWVGSSDNVGVTGYSLERCTGASCSSFSQLATPAAGATSYSDTAVAGSTSYSYRIQARDAAGNWSGYSNTATATTPAIPIPAMPAWVLPCAAPGCTQPAGTPGIRNIPISWTSTANATSYAVEYGLFVGCGEFCWTLVWSPLTTTSATSTTYTTNVPSTVWLRVKACNSSGCSALNTNTITYQ